MKNDEPAASLQYLLSPKFLSGDRSRVAIYAISSCVPYLPESKLTQTLTNLMESPALRLKMKVTSYKEIIRLLSKNPTRSNLDLILKEWQRKHVHRDIRLTILTAAFQFLTMAGISSAAWEIFEKGTALEENEILIALLGARPANPQQSHPEEDFSRLLEKSRLIEYYTTVTAGVLQSKEDCQRYLEKITLHIAKNAKEEDVAILALASTAKWEGFGHTEEVISLLLKNLCNTSVLSERVDKQTLLDNRFTHFLAQLVRLSHPDEEVFKTSDLLAVLKVHCEAYRKAREDWVLAPLLRHRITKLLETLPINGRFKFYSAEEEDTYFGQVKDLPEFSDYLLERRANVLNSIEDETLLLSEEHKKEVLEVVHAFFERRQADTESALPLATISSLLDLHQALYPARKLSLVQALLQAPAVTWDPKRVYGGAAQLSLRLFLLQTNKVTDLFAEQHAALFDAFLSDSFVLASREDLPAHKTEAITSAVGRLYLQVCKELNLYDADMPEDRRVARSKRARSLLAQLGSRFFALKRPLNKEGEVVLSVTLQVLRGLDLFVSVWSAQLGPLIKQLIALHCGASAVTALVRGVDRAARELLPPDLTKQPPPLTPQALHVFTHLAAGTLDKVDPVPDFQVSFRKESPPIPAVAFTLSAENQLLLRTVVLELLQTTTVADKFLTIPALKTAFWSLFDATLAEAAEQGDSDSQQLSSLCKLAFKVKPNTVPVKKTPDAAKAPRQAKNPSGKADTQLDFAPVLDVINTILAPIKEKPEKDSKKRRTEETQLAVHLRNLYAFHLLQLHGQNSKIQHPTEPTLLIWSAPFIELLKYFRGISDISIRRRALEIVPVIKK
eukprot:TRINITY_DN4336_c0_g1_i2.p1 TRINITY_DN4336_c0_g1~~TRINITY_DN4336_c0_g1_i2.p1  ORF type:complete len:843 (+),score=135.35 TRINITY_DN4336_c0_g1_i2:505-3033(+)